MHILYLFLFLRTLSIFFCKKIKIIIFIFLLEFKELKIKNDQWYVLFVQEILKDIKIKAGIYGDLSVEYLRKSDDETDYNENKQVLEFIILYIN